MSCQYDLGEHVIQGDLAEPEPEVPELLQQMAQKDWRNQWNKLVQLVQMDLASSVRTFEILIEGSKKQNEWDGEHERTQVSGKGLIKALCCIWMVIASL